MDYKEQEIREHLKNAGWEDDRIEVIIDCLDIDEAYNNLMINRALKAQTKDNDSTQKDLNSFSSF